MTTSEAMNKATSEIKMILNNAGLIDGDNSSLEQVATTRNPLYWDTVVKSKAGSDKEIYLVWSLVSVDAKSNADDKVRNREAYVIFDLFVRKNKLSKHTIDIIDKLDAEAIASKWAFEFKGPMFYERDAAIWQITFELTKIF